MKSDPLALFLSRLDKVTCHNGRFKTRCPAHSDKTPSLSIQEKDGVIVFHCHAGCRPEDVLSSIGLTFNDLYADEIEYKKPKKNLDTEYNVLRIANHMIDNGESLTQNDINRVELALRRIDER